MKRALLVVVIALVGAFQGRSQDQRVFSQFFMNPYIYNPAYAGVDGHAVLFGLYRSQYMGIEGAPQLSHVNFHTPLKNNLAFGALAYNETEGPLITSGAKATLGYILEVDKKHYVRFGMSLGGGYTSIDPAAIDIGLDPAFQNLTNNSFMTVDAGVTYHFDLFNVGLSFPNLISREVISQESFAPVTLNPLHNMMVKANYRGHINDYITLEPHVIYRYSTINMPQYEVAVLAHLLHVAWAGAGYRQDAGFVGFVGLKIQETFGVGFAYEIGNSELAQASSGTAEVHIGYHFPKRKKHHNHSHSFLKSHKISKEQRELAAKRRERLAQQRAEALARRQEEARLAKEAAADAAATNEITDNEAPKNEENVTSELNEHGDIVKSVPIQGRLNRSTRQREIGTTHLIHNPDGTVSKVLRWSPAPQAPTGYRINRDIPTKERTNSNGQYELGYSYSVNSRDGIKTSVLWAPGPKDLRDANINESVAKKERVNANGTKEIGITYAITFADGTRANEIRWTPAPAEEQVQAATQADETTPAGKPSMINDNTARRGHHILELPVGHHVVAAQFKDFQKAEDYSDELFERGFHGTIVGYVTALGEYMVVVHKGATPKQAEDEQAKWRKLQGLDHVYIFNVVE